jgi:CheY-like chemotaxis protein
MMPNARSFLLVEDNPVDAMAITRALGRLGAAAPMTHVTCGEEALTCLRSGEHARPSLIVLDLQMPGMTGLELLRAIKSDPALAKIPVVVLTTSDEQRDILESFDTGAAGYIVKPTDREGFLEAVKAIEGYWTLSQLPAYA